MVQKQLHPLALLPRMLVRKPTFWYSRVASWPRRTSCVSTASLSAVALLACRLSFSASCHTCALRSAQDPGCCLLKHMHQHAPAQAFSHALPSLDKMQMNCVA